jgi:hypothetical protein
MTSCLRFASVVLSIVIGVTAHASDMNRVVRAVEMDLGVHHTHIPMLGAALFMSKVISGFQMPGVKLAVFEDETLAERSPEELEHAVLTALGPEWSPFVKSSSNHGAEQNWIFLRQDGKKLQMFVATAERGELSLVEVKVSERQMRRWINDTDVMVKSKGNGRSSDD